MVLQPFTSLAETVTDLLNGGTQRAMEPDRVGDMVAVEAVRKSGPIRHRTALIRLSVLTLRPPGPDIIFRSRAAEGRRIRVSIQEELHLALAPPGPSVALLIGLHPDVDTKEPPPPCQMGQKFVVLLK